MYVKDVKDRSNTPKGCNAMYVGDVKDRSNIPKGCNAMYVGDVEDVKDRSNTPKCYIGIDLDLSKPKGMPLSLKLDTYSFTTKYINMAKA